MKRPKRDAARPQAPHPWRRQLERNIFYRPRGWWHEAYNAQCDERGRAHWRQFFRWPPPLDTARLAEIFASAYPETIAGAVAPETRNALLAFLR